MNTYKTRQTSDEGEVVEHLAAQMGIDLPEVSSLPEELESDWAMDYYLPDEPLRLMYDTWRG